jgi:hypothetical protein
MEEKMANALEMAKKKNEARKEKKKRKKSRSGLNIVSFLA